MCTVKNLSHTLHWHRRGQGQVQRAGSCHWHPHTNASGPWCSLWHWPFGTCHLSEAGFLQSLQKSRYGHHPQSSCMAPALGLSYSKLVQRLTMTKCNGCKTLVWTCVRWGNIWICLCHVALQLFDFQMQSHTTISVASVSSSTTFSGKAAPCCLHSSGHINQSGL